MKGCCDPVIESGKGDYLSELKYTTQNIIRAVLDAQKSGDHTKNIKVPLSTTPLRLPPTREGTLSELRRLQRQFISINKMHALLDMSRVAELFVEYLNHNLNN
ncbi:kti12, chromatin associated [Lunasporangiospora selenospora]|uniref:Kti12, chromatin associated n=1 Tax=Lunasporangiospora selenospora TaxID=979761 RepID=A0A9P6KDE1_9FUNG|nr:kti12, chromatin associated [Lunasporangiospora selenospora]